MIEEVASSSPSEDLDPGAETEQPETDAATDELVDELVVEDLLVEEVSIDGMCGVY